MRIDLTELNEIKRIEETLRCPHCHHGIQIEDRNCRQGYTQFRCVGCGYVESSERRSNRAIDIRWEEIKGGN